MWHPKDSREGVAKNDDFGTSFTISNLVDLHMSKKYTASNMNVPPVEARVDRWASVVEIMVSIGLLLAIVSYLLLPAMLGEHVFRTLASGAGDPSLVGDINVMLDQDKARGLFWFSALSISLAEYAVLYFIVWAIAGALRMPNLRYLTASFLCISVSSGDVVRMAAGRVPLPEGADVPVVFMSSFVDIPGIASSGFMEGLQYSALAPFMVVGGAGIILSLYRMGKARLDRKLVARKAMKP